MRRLYKKHLVHLPQRKIQAKLETRDISLFFIRSLFSLLAIFLVNAETSEAFSSVMAPPTSIDFDERSSTNDAIDDNTLPGQFVGVIVPSGGTGPFTYSLVAGDGDTDNARFTISNDTLYAAQFIDFETHPNPTNLSIRVRVTDNADAGYEQAIALSIQDIDENSTANFGSQGDEFLVNDRGNSMTNQEYVAMAGDDDGNFVVVWQDQTDGVFGQRYNAVAEPEGDVFRVDNLNNRSQILPDVAMAGDGSFVVVWQGGDDRQSQDGAGSGIIGRRYSSAGVPEDEFVVNTTGAGNQLNPAVAMNTSGVFVVAWSGAGGADADGVYARKYDATGNPVGGQFRVNTTTIGIQDAVDVAVVDGGAFSVVWRSENQASVASAGDIYIQRYAASNNPSGTEILVNTTTANDQVLPKIAVTDNGRHVVVWESKLQDGDEGGIYAQRYAANGIATGTEFQVSTQTVGNQGAPSVSMNTSGAFVIAYKGVNSGSPNNDEIRVQRYNANGTPNGDEFEANKLRSGAQTFPDVALNNNGTFVVAWEGNNLGDFDIYAQRFFTNTAPTAIALDNQVLTNGSPENTPLGTFSTTDADAGDEFFYAFVSGAGSDDNALFSIQGNQIFVNERVDAAIKPSYTVRVRSTDALGLFSSNSEAAFAITIDQSNELPTIATNTGITVLQRDTVTINQAALEVTDTESAVENITYTLIQEPANGSLQREAIALAADEKFTQADINNGLITYVHDGSQTTADSLTFKAADEAGGTTLETQVSITINPLTPPVANAGPDQVVIDENNDGQADVVFDGSASSDSDGTIASYVWRQNESDVVSGVNPTLTLDTGIHVITLVVTDNDFQTATDTVVITVNAPDNLLPTLATNAGLSLAQQGTTATITTAELEATDEESGPEAITFTLTLAPANGTLQLSGTDLAANGTFTQQDINGGSLSYTHNGSSEASDSIRFTVADALGGTIAETTFGISVNIVTGLGDQINGEIVMVYPNPSQESLYIKMKNTVGDVRIDVSNSMGKLLKSVHLSALNLQETPVDISDLTTGTYFVRIQADNQAIVKKLIKE
ncbi:cadherin-like domain-containing protein [Tunicatimonas pelagia]|uniref:cadherin-like domain-containing protein n=1 Tax=Tunicatimonas pelagia TaxID=931531 RepID=UPI0026671439|nr:cadherin-like domain-containing protein [Tunicatimonas pelagia]WKN40461.1 cadherin-like domain-containing protein [Tunicatimonas pelagia]